MPALRRSARLRGQPQQQVNGDQASPPQQPARPKRSIERAEKPSFIRKKRSWNDTRGILKNETESGPSPKRVKGPVENEQAGLERNPVQYWANTGFWPSRFANMAPAQGVKKRSRSGSESSASSSIVSSQPHGPAAEREMLTHGIYLTASDEDLSAKSKELCRDMMKKRYESIWQAIFPRNKLKAVLARLRCRNEARIFRDITPVLVPSPENLYFNGNAALEHVAEEVSADWRLVQTMGSTLPRPDFTIGLDRSAFDEGEIQKLTNYSTWERPSQFTENLFFPFLICEVKSAEQPLAKADRQSAHASSIAANAILQLYRATSEADMLKLSGQLLVFSVVHDNNNAKLYGHYPVMSAADSRPRFYRYRVLSVELDSHDQRQSFHDFVVEVYRSFMPSHVKRISDALAKMEIPLMATQGQAVPPNASPQQQQQQNGNDSGFVKPGESATQLMTQQMAQITQLNQALKAQIDRLDQKAEQLGREKEQIVADKEEASRRHDEQMALIRAQFEEQKRQQEDQRRQQDELRNSYQAQIKLLQDLIKQR